MRRCAVLALALFLTMGGDAANAAAGSTGEPQEVLLFAPGGFGVRQPIGFARRAVRDAGLEPVMAEYPLNDVSAAVNYSRRLAKEHPGSHALGFSAGGMLAANLAARDLVDRIVTVNAITAPNRLGWDGYWRDMGVGHLELLRASPVMEFRERGPHRQTLVMHADDDELIPFEQAEWLRDTSGGRLRRFEGTHGAFEAATPSAVDYLTDSGR